MEIGSYRGFPMELSFSTLHNQFEIAFKGQSTNHVFLGTDARGNITRLDITSVSTISWAAMARTFPMSALSA